MGKAGDNAHGRRLRGLIVVLWRAGLRIQEALALAVEMAREGVPLLVTSSAQLCTATSAGTGPTQARRSAARSRKAPTPARFFRTLTISSIRYCNIGRGPAARHG